MTLWGYGAIAAAAAAAACGILLYRRHTRRILEGLNRMLDAAIEGSFTEESFDESMVSALESKLARYLAKSAVSARNMRAEKDKLKALIGDISHQAKTPMANIVLYTQLLTEQPGNQACLEALDRQTRKLQGLIDALVKTSRLESGVIALHPAPGKLQTVMNSAVSQIRPKAAAKGTEIILEETSAQAVFDPKWTEEAIYNLLDNAVKYTPAGGKITVGAMAYSLFSAVYVRDTGPGICEEEQPMVFRRFYRGRDHAREDGIGIGLYLVRQIAEEQGGYVKVQSRVGTGSTFSLYLPRA